MASLTRWVLKHKRIVTLSWVVLTIAGIMAAGPATRALKQEFSVPGKEGWKTNQAIGRLYHGTGGMGAPLVPVVTLPAGQTVDEVFAPLDDGERETLRLLLRKLAGFAE